MIRTIAIAASTGALLVAGGASADRYSYFGGEVSAQEKNAAVEACEYRELVEQRRCNESLNKTACIDAVHEQCLREFGPDAPADPDKVPERR